MAAEPDAAAADSFGDWEQVHFTTTSTNNETPVSAAAATSPVTPINGDEILPPPPPPPDEYDGSGGETRSARVRRRMEALKSGMTGVVERVLRRCGGGGGGVWSCLVAAAAVLVYVKLVKWRRWVREETASRFALLIKEKDEKIRQLVLEIARLKQMFVATRGGRVHVFRFYQSRNVGL